MINRIFTLLAAAAAATVPALACTSLIAAKGATADSTVMITYAA